MIIKRFHPSPRLAPFIKEFLLIESDEDVCSKPLPGTSLVMSFRYNGSVQLKTAGAYQVLESHSLSGLRRSFRVFRYHKGAGNLLVIFREGGLNAFVKKPIPAHELFDLHISSSHVFNLGELNAVIERLAGASGSSSRIAIIESFFTGKLIDRPVDTMIHHAVRAIAESHGMIKIKDLAASLYISNDAFEKHFRSIVGATPKRIASIVRLHHFIDNYSAAASLTAAGYEAGYFDQSHLIRDFKLFTGETPGSFFSSARNW